MWTPQWRVAMPKLTVSQVKASMLDRSAFIKPIAHRGLHDLKAGRIENTAPAFVAGLAKGYGLECDLQPAEDGTPMVFHDDVVDRLIDGRGRLDRMSVKDLTALRYKNQSERIITFAEFLEICGGKGPLLVEVKSSWRTPKAGFLEAVAKEAKRYKGPLALMSFDPRVMAVLAELAPKVPRGIVAGKYEGKGWWLDDIGIERGQRLTDLLESGPAAPSFYAYHVKSLPTPVTRFLREVEHLPLFTWTVRSAADRKTAAKWADAPIFEGFEY
jgi:glycerophosphoryl diester phosphodiesterase